MWGQEGPPQSSLDPWPWRECFHVVSQTFEGDHQGRVLLNVELVQRQLVHKGPDQITCGKVKDETKENGDGQSRQSFFEDGEEEEG